MTPDPRSQRTESAASGAQASAGASGPSAASTPTFSVPQPPRRSRWTRLLLWFAGFVVFVVLLDNVIMPMYVKRGAKATVPQVVGMKRDEAMRKLDEAGYEPVQYEVRFDDKLPEGVVIRQTPEGGEETKPGRKVYLIFSGGKEMAVVPDLRGHSLRDAKMILLRGNMSIGAITYGYTDSATNGMVYGQTPPPGSRTSASTQVSVIVSQGPLLGRVPVPDLKNMTIAQATDKLREVKLELGKVNYQDGTPENAILDQYPHSGDLANEGATIDIWVARGGAAPADGPAPQTPVHPAPAHH